MAQLNKIEIVFRGSLPRGIKSRPLDDKEIIKFIDKMRKKKVNVRATILEQKVL